MQKIYIILLLILSLISCKTKINQYIKDENNVNKRNGRWKEEYSYNEGTLIAFGRYKKGEKVGTWKTYLADKLYEKSKIKKNITKTEKYFPDGKVIERGQSKLEISVNERNWFYFGDWKYYDQKGNIRYIKKYGDGKKVDSISYAK